MTTKSRMRAVRVQKQIPFLIFWSMETATDVRTVSHPWALSNPSLEGCIRRMILGTRFRGGLVGTILNTPLTKVVWRIEDAHGGDTPPDHPCCTATAFTDGHCAWVLQASWRLLVASSRPLKTSWKHQETGGDLGDLRYPKVCMRVLQTGEARHRI